MDSDEFKSMINGLANRGICIGLKSVVCEGKECENVYEIGDFLIGREQDNILKACLKGECDYVAKVLSVADATKEIEIHTFFSNIGIAPKIRQILRCDNNDIIIMDRMDVTLEQVLRSLTDEQKEYVKEKYLQKKGKLAKWPTMISKIDIEIPDTPEQRAKKIDALRQLYGILTTMYKHGYVHNDAHFDNFMFKGDRLYAIDFGYSDKPDKEKLERDIDRELLRIRGKLTWYGDPEFIGGFVNLRYLVDEWDRISSI